MQRISSHTNIVGLTEENFLVFYEENYSSFCYFANRYVCDPSIAEDIVGDVALKLWLKKGELEKINDYKAYLYISIRNACINWTRKEQNQSKKEAAFHAFDPQDQQTALENIIRTEMLQELEAAINSLPSQCRKVFVKLYLEDKSLSEVAEEMKLSIFTVKAQRQRGIQLLRKQFGTDRLVIWLTVLSLFKS